MTQQGIMQSAKEGKNILVLYRQPSFSKRNPIYITMMKVEIISMKVGDCRGFVSKCVD